MKFYKNCKFSKLRTVARKNEISDVFVTKHENGEARLTVEVKQGDVYSCEFASFSVLCRVISFWRSVKNANLISNGYDKGKVSFNNTFLKENKCF